MKSCLKSLWHRVRGVPGCGVYCVTKQAVAWVQAAHYRSHTWPWVKAHPDVNGAHRGVIRLHLNFVCCRHYLHQIHENEHNKTHVCGVLVKHYSTSTVSQSAVPTSITRPKRFAVLNSDFIRCRLSLRTSSQKPRVQLGPVVFICHQCFVTSYLR